MDTDISVNETGGKYDVVVEIQDAGKSADLQENGGSELKGDVELSRVQMNLFTTNTSTSPPARTNVPSPSPNPGPSEKPPISPGIRYRPIAKSAYAKPKSRIVEPQYPISSKPAEQNVVSAPAKSPNRAPSPSFIVSPSPHRTSVPITPRTPLMASIGGDDDDDDAGDDDDVYQTQTYKLEYAKQRKKLKVLVTLEWVVFVCLMGVLIASLTIRELRDFAIWRLSLWKWCVFLLVIFCGRLFSEWFIRGLVFLIVKNFLFKKKVLYFVFGLERSVRVVIWLALILLAWTLLINRVERSQHISRILNRITRGIVCTLVGAVMWMVKTLLVKLVASSYHVRTYFDKIQESIFHQYVLQALSGTPMMEDDGAGNNSKRFSGQLSINRMKKGNVAKEDVIDVDKLYKIKREKVSAWTMRGLIAVIRNSGLSIISSMVDDGIDEESSELKEISSEVEARNAANRIFKNVAKPGHKYIEEDDLLRFMPKEEVDDVMPLFEGITESRRIKKSTFRNWVVKAYKERKFLSLSLNDCKTAIEELNKIGSAVILVVIIIVWLLLMEITTTRVLVFISSQLLLVVFIFGNSAKMAFEAIIFVFVVHPFDVGDRCVVNGEQMMVDEMNIMTTIFLKSNNEKVYYPNSVLATMPISNFNRSPEMMGDSVDFAVDFSTSVESIAALKAKIKIYLESKPHQWSADHSVHVNEIIDVNKMTMSLYVTHTLNFQNSSERGNRRSDLVLQLKRIFEELGIKYSVLPQEVQIRYAEAP